MSDFRGEMSDFQQRMSDFWGDMSDFKREMSDYMAICPTFKANVRLRPAMVRTNYLFKTEPTRCGSVSISPH